MKKFILLLVLLTLALHAETPLEILGQADREFAARNYQDALQLYKKVTGLNPESIRALTGLAVTSDILGFRGDALNAYSRILKISPENITAVTGISRIRADRQDFQGALEILQKPLAEQPTNTSLLFAKAYIHLHEKKYSQTINLIESINKREEPTETTLAMLANAYAGAGYYNRAFKLLNELIEKNPDNPEFFVTTANVYIYKFEKSFKPELIGKATEALDNALSLYPSHIAARRLITRLKIYSGEYEEAANYIAALVKEFPDDAELHFLAGYIYSKTGNQLAVRYYQKGLNLNDLDESGRLMAEDYALNHLKENHPFRQKLGKYRFNQSVRMKKQLYYGYSLFNLQRAAKLSPDNYTIKLALSDFYRESGNSENYIKLLLILRNERPDDLALKNELKTAVSKLKETLAYREGLVQINDDSVKIDYQRTPQSVFLYDISTEPLISSYPGISRIFSEIIREYLANYAEFRIISGGNYLQIAQNFSGNTPYSGSVPFTPGSRQFLVFKNKKVNYFIHGTGEFNQHLLSMKLDITDNHTGNIKQNFSIRSSNRDSAAILAASLAGKLKSIPYTGSIIRLKSENFIINMGTLEGLKTGTIVAVTRAGNEIGRARITEVSRFLAAAVPITRDFFRMTKEGDVVVKIK